MFKQIQIKFKVGDVAWAPYSSTVFAAVTVDGKVIMDIFYFLYTYFFLYILWIFSTIRITNALLNILALISFFFDSNLQCPIVNLCSILDSHISQILIALIKRTLAQVHIYDLYINKYNPVCVQAVVPKKKVRILKKNHKFLGIMSIMALNIFIVKTILIITNIEYLDKTPVQAYLN